MFEEIKPGTKFKATEVIEVWYDPARTEIPKGQVVTFDLLFTVDGPPWICCSIGRQHFTVSAEFFREHFTFA
jgi:hypothetical protein